MRGSHPPTLITLARATLAKEVGLGKGQRVLVAVSGGPDSMALLHVMSKLGVDVIAHGVDHGLRDGAAAELDLAAALADSLGVRFERTVVSVSRGGNLQARARKARFDALRSAAAKASCDLIATAHHADDRAETVVLRLLRGAGPSGLAVLPPREGDLVRPLIRARRADVLAHLERHRISFATDPSNASPAFLRTRVRLEVMPLLATLGPGIVQHLCALADQLAPQHAESPSFAIPRATQRALLEVIETRKGEVWLPGGLIARPAPPSVIKKDEHAARHPRRRPR